jgi:hypothetical protein
MDGDLASSTLTAQPAELEIDNFDTFDVQLNVLRPTPQHWTASRALRTPNSIIARTCDSNVSSITCMKYKDLQDSSEREAATNEIQATPLRDLMPADPDLPSFHCPMSVESLITVSDLSDSMNKENDSPQPVAVLSPATAFRMKRAVFESAAQAVKSPARRTRARNVSAFDSTPTSVGPVSCPTTATTTDDTVSLTSTLDSEEAGELLGSPITAALLMEAKPVGNDDTDSSKEDLNAWGKVESEVCDQKEEELIAEDAAGVKVAQYSRPAEVIPVPAFTSAEERAPPRPQTPWTRQVLLLCGAAFILYVWLGRTFVHPTQPTILVTQPSAARYSDLQVLEATVQEDEPFIETHHDEVSEVPAFIEEMEPPEVRDEGARLNDLLQASAPQAEEGTLQQDAQLLLADLRTILAYQWSTFAERVQALLQSYHFPQRTRQLRRQLRKLQRRVQPALQEMAGSVLSFHYPLDLHELNAELSALSVQLESHIVRIQNGFFSVREATYEKVPFLPVLEQAVVHGGKVAQRQVVEKVQQTHGFLKQHELLPEVYVPM